MEMVSYHIISQNQFIRIEHFWNRSQCNKPLHHLKCKGDEEGLSLHEFLLPAQKASKSQSPRGPALGILESHGWCSMPIESMDGAPAEVPESPEHASLAEVWDCKLIIITSHYTVKCRRRCVSSWFCLFEFHFLYVVNVPFPDETNASWKITEPMCHGICQDCPMSWHMPDFAHRQLRIVQKFKQIRELATQPCLEEEADVEEERVGMWQDAHNIREIAKEIQVLLRANSDGGYPMEDVKPWMPPLIILTNILNKRVHFRGSHHIATGTPIIRTYSICSQRSLR